MEILKFSLISVRSSKSDSEDQTLPLTMVRKNILTNNDSVTLICSIPGCNHRSANWPGISSSRLLVRVFPLQTLQPQILCLSDLLQCVPGQTLPAGQVRPPQGGDGPLVTFLFSRPVNADSGYTTPTNCDNNNSSKNVNILMNGNQSKPASANSKLERTKLSCTGTLQKVKRVYL